MPSLNEVRLMGNLTRDPELKYTKGGTAYCNVSLAVNRNWRDRDGGMQEEVTFVEVTFWGRTAEVCSEYTSKGSPLYVGGRLKLDQWEDKETGKRRSKLSVVGDQLQLIGGRGGSSHGRDYGEEPSEPREPPISREIFPDDDVPF